MSLFGENQPIPHGGMPIRWTIYAESANPGAKAKVIEICVGRPRGIVIFCDDCKHPDGMTQVSTKDLRRLAGDNNGIHSCVFKDYREALRVAACARFTLDF